MPLLFLLLLIGVPSAEIALLIEVGGLIGLWPTLLAILLTALVGTGLVRAQGMETLARARVAMDQGRAPVAEALTGICLLLAGALLLAPGFITDAVGLALLMPPVRRVLALWFFTRLRRQGGGNMGVHMDLRDGPDGADFRPHAGVVVDGEYSVATTADDGAESAADKATDTATDKDTHGNGDGDAEPPPRRLAGQGRGLRS